MKKTLLSLCFAAISLCGMAQVPADGAYFLYNADSQLYLTRNGCWGTQAVLNEYAQPVTVSSADGVYTLNFLDQKGLNYETGKPYTIYIIDSGATYTDRDFNNAWTIESVDGGCAIKSNHNDKYLIVKDGAVKYPSAEAEKSGAATWQFLTGEEYAKKLADKKVAQLNALLAKAGFDFTVTSEAELDRQLTTVVDFTADVTLPTDRGEAYQAISDNGSDLADYTTTPLQFTIKVPQAGFYRIDVPAMYRIANNAVTTEAMQAGVDYFNAVITTADYTVPVLGASAGLSEEKLSSNVGSATIGGKTMYWPNDQDSFQAWANAGNYANSVYAYADKADAEITVKVLIRTGRIWNQQWFVHNAPLTRVYHLSTKTQANLDNFYKTIDDVKAMLGFGVDEYAPYTNVEAMQLLDEALAADVFFNQSLADKYVADLKDAANKMVKNTSVMDAVYNGTFALCENNGAMPGWMSTTHELGNANGDFHSRALVCTEGDNFGYLAALQPDNTKRAAAYLRFDGKESLQTTQYKYGASSYAYSMPLVADKEYTLSLDYGSWNVAGRDTRFYVTDASGKVVASKITIPENLVASGKATHIEIAFTPSVSGNCVLAAQNPGAEDKAEYNSAIAVTNISIKPTSETSVDPGKGGIQFGDADFETPTTPATYYNLQGVKVENPAQGGVYIRVENGKASKIIR